MSHCSPSGPAPGLHSLAARQSNSDPWDLGTFSSSLLPENWASF